MSFYVNDSKGFREIVDFDTAIQTLKNSYEYMKDRVTHMQDVLDLWNKDQEIQDARKQADYFRQHSLLTLSDKELAAVKAFREKHWKECAEPLKSKAKGNTYIYELTGTGIGTCIKITCPICGRSEDITDIDSW